MDLAGYQFGEQIAEGGMATVYKGVQLSLHRPVAIKVLSRQMQAHDVALEAFERESLIIAQLNHPNIIHVIDKGMSAQGSPFFIMEYVDGQDLGALMREDVVPPMRRVEICLQICKALGFAHRNGIIHRDIKPGNVLVDGELNVKVVDFGIALLARKDVGDDVDSAQEVMGTLRYMAPELRKSISQANEKSDIYALGVLMFELFTRQLPQPGQTIENLGIKIPPRLQKLIDASLSEDPEQRPASVMVMHDQLLQLLRGAHLNPKQAAKAKNTLDKKTFTLLDILADNERGGLYLFQEKNTDAQVLVRKCNSPSPGYEVALKMAEVSHRHLVRVHGVSKNERAFIIVSDYMIGGSLQERLIRPLAPEDFLPIAQQICSGLQFAHQQNLFHGNLKADAVFFDESGAVKLGAFGLEDASKIADQGDAVSNDLTGGVQLTGVQRDIRDAGKLFYRILVGEEPRWYRGRLQQGKALMRVPEILRLTLIKMLGEDGGEGFLRMSAVSESLDTFNEELKTQILVQESVPEPVAQEKKKILLLLLLVLFFLTLLNTSVLVILELDNDIIQSLRESLRNLLD